MVKVIIVDDEALARQRIKELLMTNSSIDIIAECQSGTEAIDSILELRPDLVYLDIQLIDMTGFNVLEAIPKEIMPMVVFVTAFDEYAIKAFEVFSFDYLLKPFKSERFLRSLDKAIENLQLT